LNFLFGTGGFAKEVDWLIHETRISKGDDYTPHYYVAEDTSGLVGQTLNGREIISESSLRERFGEGTHNCFIAVGSPYMKQKIVMQLKNDMKSCSFPNLIHPNVLYDRRFGKVLFGEGNIICAGCILTTDIVIENFVHLNLGTTVGHDTVIGNYATISPKVGISGNVRIGDRVFLGTGANVLERLAIFSDIIVGAGATVVRDLREPGTYVGTPAKKMNSAGASI
jgi:sugar O-acyltransferase (sialic acid O-acetyltransferase NeuD family)